MSENSNSNSNSNSRSFFDWSFGDWMITFIIVLFCCNKCVYPVLDDREIDNKTEFTQLVFIDSTDVTIDGKYICPAVKCEKGGFLSEHTHMIYTISGADSCVVISDAFTVVSNNDYLYSGKLITDKPFVPIRSLSNLNGGETLDISFVEDGYSRINTRNATVHNKFYVVPRAVNQSFDKWMDSCLVVAGLKDIADPFFSAVFLSEGKVEKGIYIGDYSPSKYEQEEYIAKLNKYAYKDRNNTPLQINDVVITYHCEGTAANIAVTFEPLADTLNCCFVYYAINEYNWARTDNNIRSGFQNTTVLPGQTKYEFNVTPELISNNLESHEKIADLALVGVTEGDSVVIFNDSASGGLRMRAKEGVDLAMTESKSDMVKSDPVYVLDYDHRSSFWQKITLRPDLCASWWKLIIAVAVAILSIFVLKEVDHIIPKGLARSIVTALAAILLVLTIVYAVIWLILVFF